MTQSSNSSERLRIAVIGAGIVGVSVGSYLLRDGHSVVLIDAAGPAEGASKGNAGALSPGSCVPLAMPGMYRKVPGWLFDPDGPLVIRPSYFLRALPWLIRFSLAGRTHRIPAIADALYRLHSRTFDFYAPLLKNAGAEAMIVKSGTLVVFDTEVGFCSSAGDWEIRESHGARVERLRGEELRQIEPALSPHYAAGVLLPDHGYTVDPYRMVRRLAKRFQQDGGQFMKARVANVRPATEGGMTLATEAGEIAADKVVIAAGAWSKALVAGFGVRVPLESQRGYHVTLTAPGIEPRLPVSSSEGKFYATPMVGGLRVAGTVEFAGLDAPPDFRRARRLLGQVRRMYPGIATDSFSEWMGHRPCLPDSLPLIGFVPGRRDILLAFGHGHNGMTSGPVTGALIADLVAGRPPAIDLSPYRPDRF